MAAFLKFNHFIFVFTDLVEGVQSSSVPVGNGNYNVNGNGNGQYLGSALPIKPEQLASNEQVCAWTIPNTSSCARIDKWSLRSFAHF